ncbi:MAG: phosphate ABC transporter permease [Haloplanus sp.]
MTARPAVDHGRHRWQPPVPEDRRRAVVTGVTGVAAVALVLRFLATALANVPGGLAGLGLGSLTAGTTAVAALAAVGLALTEPHPTAGVGLLFVGVFGLLTLVSNAVAVPAAAAVVAGAAAVAVTHRRRMAAVSSVAVGVLLIALGVGVVSGVGRVVSLRSLGSTLALAGVAITPVFAATTARAALGGALAFVAVVAIGLSQPFVAGAITLVGGGVVGTSLPVVAFAVAGAVTTASAAVREAEWVLLAGVVLLAFAGVPSTLDRAIPFALGATTLTLREGRR